MSKNRYEIRTGKYGQFFYDTQAQYAMSLDIVLEKLNRIEGYKERLLELGKPD